MAVLYTQCISVQYPKGDENGVREESKLLENQLKRDVTALATSFGERYHEKTANLDRAADFLAKQLAAAGCCVNRQSYEVDGRTFQNVTALLPGKKDDRIIIGAHYDVCSHNNPGADDNASGVAGLLALARMLGNIDLNHTVELVAYSTEEPPYFRTENMGSARHAAATHAKGVTVKAMICLEMIGYYTDEPNSQTYPVGLMKLFLPTTGNFIGIVGNGGSRRLAKILQKVMRNAGTLPVARVNFPQSIGLSLDFSDHRNYWAYGYPSVMITDTSFYRNPNYHKPTDTPETLDYTRMADVVHSLFKGIVALDAKE